MSRINLQLFIPNMWIVFLTVWRLFEGPEDIPAQHGMHQESIKQSSCSLLLNLCRAPFISPLALLTYLKHTVQVIHDLSAHISSKGCFEKVKP